VVILILILIYFFAKYEGLCEIELFTHKDQCQSTIDSQKHAFISKFRELQDDIDWLKQNNGLLVKDHDILIAHLQLVMICEEAVQRATREVDNLIDLMEKYCKLKDRSNSWLDIH